MSKSRGLDAHVVNMRTWMDDTPILFLKIYLFQVIRSTQSTPYPVGASPPPSSLPRLFPFPFPSSSEAPFSVISVYIHLSFPLHIINIAENKRLPKPVSVVQGYDVCLPCTRAEFESRQRHLFWVFGFGGGVEVVHAFLSYHGHEHLVFPRTRSCGKAPGPPHQIWLHLNYYGDSNPRFGWGGVDVVRIVVVAYTHSSMKGGKDGERGWWID